ncbi:MAG: chemotaxis protein CheC [Pseudomonadota bacterium]
MTKKILTSDQRDALQEVTNIAMGQAGASLAQVLGEFVQLSVPQINVIELEEINQALAMLVGATTVVSAVRQAFTGALRGEAVAIFDQEGCIELAELMGYEKELTPKAEQELMLDVANVLIGACIKGITKLLQTDITFSPPSVMAKNMPIGQLMHPSTMEWKLALVTEVNFALEKGRFTCHLTQFWPESSIVSLAEALDKFIESF